MKTLKINDEIISDLLFLVQKIVNEKGDNTAI